MEYKLHQGSLINGQTVTRDVLGRVISQDLARAGHNTRGELTADTVSTGDSQAYTWAYDPIGNRKQAWTSRDYVSKTYHTNNLNQYTEITDDTRPSFTPAHDQEGNQTLVRTNTGDWQVIYNAENRPVTFTKDSLRIENKYDYRGRRVEKATYSNNQLQKRLRFLYNGYLQIAAIDATNTATPVLLHTLYWDPTEPVATRPLLMARPEDNAQNWYEYTHTLNKNVSHLIDKTGSIVAHYDYDAYGNMIEQTGVLANRNPTRFSSEYDDEDLGLIYYNYRHYNPSDGRWINRDPITESGGNNLYGFVFNYPFDIDYLGLDSKTLFQKNDNSYRLDVETNESKGTCSLHIQIGSNPKNKYDYRTDKPVPGFYHEDGRPLPQSIRKDIIKHQKEWDKHMKKAKNIIDRNNGLSPKFGGGSILAGILLFIYLADTAALGEKYCTAMNSGEVGQMDEIYNDMIDNMPDMGTMGRSELRERTKDYHEKLKDYAGEIRRNSTNDEWFYK